MYKKFETETTFKNCCTSNDSLQELKFSTKVFQIHPNPAHKMVNVIINDKIDENATITLYDSTRLKVMDFSVANNQKLMQINLSELQNGIYFIHYNSKLHTEEHILVKK